MILHLGVDQKKKRQDGNQIVRPELMKGRHGMHRMHRCDLFCWEGSGFNFCFSPVASIGLLLSHQTMIQREVPP